MCDTQHITSYRPLESELSLRLVLIYHLHYPTSQLAMNFSTRCHIISNTIPRGIFTRGSFLHIHFCLCWFILYFAACFCFVNEEDKIMHILSDDCFVRCVDEVFEPPTIGSHRTKSNHRIIVKTCMKERRTYYNPK